MPWIDLFNWQLGSPVASTYLNAYSNNLYELASMCINVNWATRGAVGHDKIYMVHRHTWLYYVSESQERPGAIFPYDTSVAPSESLPYAPDGAYYNLDENLHWMVFNRPYGIENVQFAFESEEVI